MVATPTIIEPLLQDVLHILTTHFMVFFVVALVQGGISDIMINIIVKLKFVYKLFVKKKKKTIDKKSDQCNKRKKEKKKKGKTKQSK